MRKVLCLFALLGSVIACNNTSQPTTQDTTKQKDSISVPQAKVDEDSLNAFADNAYENSYPGFHPEKFPWRIHQAGSVFHDGEVDPKISNTVQVGLFKRDENDFYLDTTFVTTSREYDAVLDEDTTAATGWKVMVTKTDEPILLMPFGKSVKPIAKVASIPMTEAEKAAEAGYTKSFTFFNKKYKLVATGEKLHVEDHIETRNYKLMIEYEKNGKQEKQLLVSLAYFDDVQHIEILFAGDVDGDELPDFIINTSYHYNLSAPTLYLSSEAKGNDLLRVMGVQEITGC
ncbi:hypothetical protein LX64_04002 [Chitinophaga skermanii]|uniref:Lipoprotein n=1 Tax=Chitinophaga skermanii TaxID=331697 RepID=A0A327Q7E7_9BACT|nr:hypothetical protein [Chitinophaga skermanii]RAJ00300.1 hypothetical protein LX64_04002 [Chitinophaga skermanii]